MEQGHEGLGVGAVRCRAVVGGLPVAFRDRAKQLDGLVDQVGAEVVEDAAAFGQGGGVPPVPEAFRPPPLKARLEGPDLPQRAVREELLERQEVGVPPAVLEHRELHAGVGRPGDEFFTVGRRGDEGLVHHHVEAVGDRRGGEVEVRQRRGAEDHEVQVPGEGEQRLRASGRSGRCG